MADHDVLVVGDVLDFFNNVGDANVIRQRIRDDPNFGAARAYGIGLSTAENILAERLARGRDFESLADIDDVAGVGRDTMHNILYSFRPRTEASALYRSFRSYLEVEGTARPLEGAVLHVGEQFQVTATVHNVAPPPDRLDGVPGITFGVVEIWATASDYLSGLGAHGVRIYPAVYGPTDPIPLHAGEARAASWVLTAGAVNDGSAAPIVTVVARVTIDTGELGTGAPPQVVDLHSFFRVDKSVGVYHPILPD